METDTTGGEAAGYLQVQQAKACCEADLSTCTTNLSRCGEYVLGSAVGNAPNTYCSLQRDVWVGAMGLSELAQFCECAVSLSERGYGEHQHRPHHSKR